MSLSEGAMTSPAPFAIELRVYYQQTDAAGVVYHSNYLGFMEAARTEYLRSLGIDLVVLADEDAAMFVVHRADVRFRRPARLDDLVRVTARVTQAGRARVQFLQTVLRGDECLIEAEVELACVHRHEWRPIALPRRVRAALENDPR